MDAGATGLTRGGNAEIGVMRMESAMKRCGRGDRIRKHERRRHRKTRSHRPRSESAAATGTEKSESGRKRRIPKRGGESGGKGKTPNQIEKSHRRPRLFQETPEKELKYRREKYGSEKGRGKAVKLAKGGALFPKARYFSILATLLHQFACYYPDNSL